MNAEKACARDRLFAARFRRTFYDNDGYIRRSSSGRDMRTAATADYQQWILNQEQLICDGVLCYKEDAPVTPEQIRGIIQRAIAASKIDSDK